MEEGGQLHAPEALSSWKNRRMAERTTEVLKSLNVVTVFDNMLQYCDYMGHAVA
jgi:hypothetical protein